MSPIRRGFWDLSVAHIHVTLQQTGGSSAPNSSSIGLSWLSAVLSSSHGRFFYQEIILSVLLKTLSSSASRASILLIRFVPISLSWATITVSSTGPCSLASFFHVPFPFAFFLYFNPCQESPPIHLL